MIEVIGMGSTIGVVCIMLFAFGSIIITYIKEARSNGRWLGPIALIFLFAWLCFMFYALAAEDIIPFFLKP